LGLASLTQAETVVEEIEETSSNAGSTSQAKPKKKKR
jgi:hypothetical protein